MRREQLELPSIYFAHVRPVVRRNGALVPVTPLTPPRDGEAIEQVSVRFRTVGDITCTAPVESAADLAIILVDARKGVQTQTRRHSCIAHLVGIPHLVVAVSKMDLVDYSQEFFDRIRQDYLRFAATLGIRDVRFIPISALEGDMVVERGKRLPWYKGPALMELLETSPPAHHEAPEQLRFPVQYVCRPRTAEHRDYRGYMGRIESGEVAIGDEVQVLPSGRRTRTKIFACWTAPCRRPAAGARWRCCWRTRSASRAAT